ncbi:9184_t:CDS:2, partial [Dentiscutata heterogama]
CFDTQGGHLFQRLGKGKDPFSCKDKHRDDTTQALDLLGQWILNIAASNNSEYKEQLLTYLNSTLSIFDKTKSHISEPPSLLYVKTALRLGQVNLIKIMEDDHNLTPEKSKKVGESLGIVTWKSRHEVRQNKEILENPNSLAEYQSAFPASVQSERDRIQTLLSEYIGDIFTINKDRNVQSRKEAIWKLVESLLAAFQLPDPTTHELFVNTMEINETGFSLLSSCYMEGINRQNSLYRQEILKVEKRVVKGRRRHDINVYKLSSFNNAKEILSQLLTCNSFSDDDKLLYEVLHKLQDVDPGWTKERVIMYWRNHKK